MNKIVSVFKLDTKEIQDELGKEQYSLVYLQLPEGLQHYALEIKTWLEDQFDITIILDANPCYGSCDIPEESMLEKIKVNAVVQIGHVPIPSMNINNQSIPIFFVNALSTIPIEQVLKKSIPHLVGKQIGIITTAQYFQKRKDIKKILENNGFTITITKGDTRLSFNGHVLGCNFTSATRIAHDVDSFLFVGSGLFHPLGLLLSTNKPVICADPYSNQVIDTKTLEEKKQQVLKQRYGAIASAEHAQTIAIIIGLKPGQMRYHYALQLEKSIQEAGKQSLLLAADTITSSFIDRFPFVDVFVSTACPRIAIDDYPCYKKPILTPIELEIALHKKDWDEYVFDEITD
ncbi:MAG: diphthamide biosynthesis enzyme Dph2 [Candidatus Thermoplasmatota archaeon]|nr:diphthamide biosynthesis enzyme Dph2 [Candidatus Thermoplasmatota archaeon]